MEIIWKMYFTQTDILQVWIFKILPIRKYNYGEKFDIVSF